MKLTNNLFSGNIDIPNSRKYEENMFGKSMEIFCNFFQTTEKY